MPDGWVRGPDRRFLSKISKIDNKSPLAMQGAGGQNSGTFLPRTAWQAHAHFRKIPKTFFCPHGRSTFAPAVRGSCLSCSQDVRVRHRLSAQESREEHRIPERNFAFKGRSLRCSQLRTFRLRSRHSFGDMRRGCLKFANHCAAVRTAPFDCLPWKCSVPETRVIQEIEIGISSLAS